MSRPEVVADRVELGRRIAAGAGWMVLMRLAVRTVGIISTIMLARLLVPADFGLVALATMLAGLLEVASGFNFSIFLVREPRLDRSHYDTAWTLSVIRGVAIAVLLAAAAPTAAGFFNDPRLEAVIHALAISAAITGCANIGITDFQRYLDFRKEFRLLVYTRMVSFCVTIICAVALRSYWALVIGILSGKLVSVVLSYLMHPFRPRLSLARTRQIMRFSKWLLANGLLSFVGDRSDVFIIGRLLDTATLGLYAVAREISELASTEFIAPIQRALLPGLSRLSEDRAAIHQAFIETQAVIVLLALPLAAGIGLVADPLVRVALGGNWAGAVPVIQILAIAGIARVCRACTTPFMIASGRPELATLIIGVGTATSVAAQLWAVTVWGIVGAAWAVCASGMVELILTYAVLARSLAVTPTAIARAIWRPAVSCLVMAWAVERFLALWPRAEAIAWHLGALLGATAAGALAYIAAQLILWRLCGAPEGAERRVLDLLGRAAGHLRAQRAVGRA